MAIGYTSRCVQCGINFEYSSRHDRCPRCRPRTCPRCRPRTPGEGATAELADPVLRPDVVEAMAEHFVVREITPVDRLHELEAEIQRLRDAASQAAHEIEQIAGKALGYPKLYPEVSDVDDGTVCVGEHVPVTIVQELANAYTKLKADYAALLLRHADEGE